MEWLRKFLFKDEPVVGIKKTTDYPYMKIQKFLLHCLGSWPPKKSEADKFIFKTSFIKAVTFIIIILSFTSEIIFVKLNHKLLSFIEIGHTYITIFMTLLNLSRSVSLTYSKKFENLARDFVEGFHLFHYKGKSQFAMKIHKRVHFICHLFALYLYVQMFGGMTFFNLVPMFNNILAGRYMPGGLGNSTYEYAVYFAYPFDTATSTVGHFIALTVNWIVSILCTTWFCAFDLMLSVMIFHIWGHFKILMNQLASFPVPPVSMVNCNGITVKHQIYTENDLKMVSKMLRECVNYHREIGTFTKRMSETFGTMLLAYYMFFQTTCCILLLECAQMTAEALFRYAPLTVIVFQQLIQLSCIIELIGATSEKLKDAVYDLPWEHMDTKNRKIVYIFLINVQEPIHLKALGVAEVGVTTMAAILKTSFSYFIFLRSM